MGKLTLRIPRRAVDANSMAAIEHHAKTAYVESANVAARY